MAATIFKEVNEGVKFEKVREDAYATPDRRYVLLQLKTWCQGCAHLNWHLYKDGEYMGMPDSVELAELWINYYGV